MENVLWISGLLGDSCAEVLVNTMVYVLGLYLALRGREEHRNLRRFPPQLCVKTATNRRRLSTVHGGRQQDIWQRSAQCAVEAEDYSGVCTGGLARKVSSVIVRTVQL